MAEEIDKLNCNMNRRHFLSKTSLGLGSFALASLLSPKSLLSKDDPFAGAIKTPHVLPKAKRIIYLFQSGGPSQHDMFDYKPSLEEMNGQDLPPSVRGEQRLTGMTANQNTFPMAGSRFKFKRHGKSGAWVSDLLPHTGGIADELCFIKTVYTEAINHDPAITFFQTGTEQAGLPSMGSWISYGLGSDNENLPAFSVLVSRGTGRPFDQPLYSRLWGNGFLPSLHQGVQYRAGSDPVLNLNDPGGVNTMSRRNMLSSLKDLNELHLTEYGDSEITTRIAQYEMAYRMQTSVPETMDLSDEPESTFDLYGEEARTPGTYAANCLLARRLAERDVKFIQLYHMGWDQHNGIPDQLPMQCKDIDQASAGLVKDLKQRGLLDDTLVIWGGEFGRTAYCQGQLTNETYGRDHHPRCFTMWMAGGGIKSGITHGETDEFGYNIVKDPVHVHDIQATVLHLMGIDHEKLTYKDQGRRFRLTDVHGKVVHDIIA
ncbi:MAG: DUF1501 domain-containing protein [Balneolales bacterium]